MFPYSARPPHPKLVPTVFDCIHGVEAVPPQEAHVSVKVVRANCPATVRAVWPRVSVKTPELFSEISFPFASVMMACTRSRRVDG